MIIVQQDYTAHLYNPTVQSLPVNLHKNLLSQNGSDFISLKGKNRSYVVTFYNSHK